MDDRDGTAIPWVGFINNALSPLCDIVDKSTDLEPGQLWRARWDDAVSIVFVDQRIGTFQNLLRVAPVTVGGDMADEWTVILPKESTSLSVALSVWTELATDIAEVVLEQYVANVRYHNSLATLIEASENGLLARGFPILNEDGRRADHRRELSFIMEALSSAVTLISGNGALPDLILAATLSVTAIVKSLGIETAAALRISKGLATVDVVQARRLAPLLNVGVGEVLASNPVVEEGLIAAITRASVRPGLARLEAEDELVDSEALVVLTQGALALAARKEGDERVWDARVNLYFQSRFGDQLHS